MPEFVVHRAVMACRPPLVPTMHDLTGSPPDCLDLAHRPALLDFPNQRRDVLHTLPFVRGCTVVTAWGGHMVSLLWCTL
jgi:hypothetical protein